MADSRPVRCANQSMSLRMRLERSDLELGAIYFDGKAIERARRRTCQHFAVDRKRGGVARADEIVCGWVPMISAAQMRALRRERDHLAVGLLHHPGRGLFAGDL